MHPRVLYLGDTSLQTAAGYLAGLLAHWDVPFHYVPSDADLTDAALIESSQAIIVSDYPAARIGARTQELLINRVHEGAGLCMIGGWESFHGLGGDWDGTPLAEILPVEIAHEDDRLNCDQVVLVRQTAEHPVIGGLPWHEHPPTIGGLNRTTAKPGAEILLEAHRFDVSWKDGQPALAPEAVHPLLVVGKHGQGRTAALMTDVAPHWVGPLVDWGPERVTAQAPGAEAVEVGNLYAQFFKQLVHWLLDSVP